MSQQSGFALNSDWLVPEWPAPARVRALCTTRAGGQSSPPFNSLNLGPHVGDMASAVAANRAVLRQAIGARPVFLSQRHGTEVLRLQAQTEDDLPADGCITDQSTVACTIMVADCLPLLLTDRHGTAVAAAHAGWRGLAGHGGHGIVEATVQSFAVGELMAWLGPCIGRHAFEVGDEVRQVFVATQPSASACFAPRSTGKWLADLQALARLRLQALGVKQIYGNDGSPAWCTVSNPSRFFSHRRDHVSGRLAACIWLV